jgi:hypothetical protein
MAYNEDTFSVICSFLKPVDLVKSRYISHHHNIWVKKFLLLHYNTVHINKYLCPMCGDLHDTYDDNLLDRKHIYGHIKTFPESLEEYIGFNDFYYSESELLERYEKVQNLFQYKNYERRQIVCENCSRYDFQVDSLESDMTYLIRVNDNRKLRKIFRYAGDRDYYLCIIPNNFMSWAILFYEDDNIIYWNQFTATIPTLQTFFD